MSEEKARQHNLTAADFSLFEASPGLRLLLCPDAPTFTIFAASQNLCKLFGMSREEILNKTLSELQEKLDINLQASLQYVIKHKQPHELPAQRNLLNQKNGGDLNRYWKVSNHPYLNHEGDLAYIITSFEEVTGDVLAGPKVKSAMSQQKAYKFFMNAPVIIGYVRGDDYVIELANEGLLEVWARTEEVIGQPLVKAIPELQEQGFIALLDQVRITGKSFYAYEYPITLNRHGIDEVLYFDFVYKPFYEDEMEAKATGVISVGYNVTAQVLSKKKVEESELKYRSLFQFMNQGLCILEMIDGADNAPVDFEYVEVNPMFEKQTGMKDVLGKRIRDLLPGLEAHWFERYKQVVNTGKACSFSELSEYMGRWFDVYAFRLGDNESRRVAILFTDISEERKAEQHIRESEERFRHLADDSPMFVFILDPTPEATVSYWNRTWLEYTGQSFDEAVGRAWDNIIHPDDIPVVLTHYVPSFERRTSYFLPAIRVKRFDGEYRWHAFKGNPRYLVNGDFNGYVGVGLDIHEQKLAEDALKESEAQLQIKVAERTAELQRTVEELKQSNANLEQFAYAASHDLKEPIRKISFFSSQLKSGLDDVLKEDDRRVFERMENALKRMNALIDDLLTYSEVSMRSASSEMVDLTEVIKVVLEELDLEIEQNQAEIKVGELFKVPGLQRQFQQAFQNLISNSLKYTKPGVKPQINISSRRVAGSEVKRKNPVADAGRDYYLVSIQDNGIGFQQADAERIFNVFTRLHGKNEFKGTGIGLSIVRKVIENHQGFIFADSEPGKGATFNIYLPV